MKNKVMNTNEYSDFFELTKKTSHLYTAIFILCSLITFFLSIFLGDLYVGGDQVHYRNVYEVIPAMGVKEAFEYYNRTLSSVEPVYFLLVWLFGGWVPKVVFMALANVVLVHAVWLCCLKERVSASVFLFFCISNFYFFVLFFAAERLKFGAIFYFYSYFFYGRRGFLLLSLLSVFSHVQMLAFYVVSYLYMSTGDIVYALKEKRIRLSFFSMLVVGGLMMIAVAPQVLAKIDSYLHARSVSELFKIFIFFCGALFYSVSRVRVVVVFLFLFLMVFFLGGERMNMVGFFFFLYVVLKHRSGINLGFLVTAIYFAFASLLFSVDIIEHGNGFNQSYVNKHG